MSLSSDAVRHLMGGFMPAVIRRLITRPDRLRRDEAEALRQALLPFVDGGESSSQLVDAGRTLLAHVDRLSASSNRWTFVMLSPDQNAAVVEFLAANSGRPIVSVRLWALCFRHLRTDTGEIMLGRDELAKSLGVTAGEVSRCMSELVKFGAILRVRERVGGMRGPGVVRYFMNPRVGTHLSGQARDAAQAAAPMLKVIDGTSHPSQRRCRAPSFVPTVL